MIDLKRNSKKEPVKATGLRTRASSSYSPNQKEDFKISRGRFSNFLTCKRCFYLDRVKGLKDPGMPGWSLNVAVDELLKKEFDLLREQKKPHPIFKKHNLNFIPFQHEKMDHWRNSLKGGISYLDKDTNLEIYGGVDDIWYDLDKEELESLEKSYDEKFENLKQILVEKLFSIVNGKTCQGITNDLGEEILPKGKKYSLKLLSSVDDYTHLSKSTWTTSKETNSLIADLISFLSLEVNLLKDKYCRGQNKKNLCGIMEVYTRPTYKANISSLLL